MNDDLLAKAVGDWLEATDSPALDPGASRARAVAGARASSQVGSGWRVDRRADGGSMWRWTAAAAVALVLGSVLLLGALVPGESQPSLTAGHTAFPSTIHWQTEVVDLRAESMRLDVEGKVFTTAGAPVAIGSDPGDATSWTLEVEWPEHGVGQRLYLYFVADDRDWWVREVRTYDGFAEGEWVYADGPFLRTPLGEVFEGDVRIDLVGRGRPDAPGNHVEAALSIDRLRVSATPHGRDEGAADAVVHRLLRGARSIRDGLLPQPTRAPATPEPMGVTVVAQAGGLTLTGELLDNGVVRIVDDGAGNKLEPVVSVALAPDGTLWVARHKAILALGRPGEVKIAAGAPQGKIERIEANADGSLTVYADGVWRLHDRDWTLLEPAPPDGWFYDQDEGRSSLQLPDGSVWRLPAPREWIEYEQAVGADTLDLRSEDRWTSFTMEEVFPITRAQFPDMWISPRLVPPIAPGGGLWVSSQRSLSRSDGQSWTEVAPDKLATLSGAPVLVKDVLLDAHGTLWVLAHGAEKGADRARVQRLLRLADGAWETIPLDEGLPWEATRKRFYGLDPTDSGGVILLEQDKKADYRYDGSGLVRIPAPGPHDTVTMTDGSVFGTARPRSLGLLMIPAGEIRPVDRRAPRD